MTYQMYRSTTLGDTLQRSLDELIADGQISQQLASRVLTTFDKCINTALSTRARNKTSFKNPPKMSEESFRLDIEDIPIPMPKEGDQNNSGSTTATTEPMDEDMNESWKRAKNALSQIGGGRPALLPTPSATTTSKKAPAPFGFPPTFQGFPNFNNNNISRLPNFPPASQQTTSCYPSPFYSQPTTTVLPTKTNSFRSFASRPFAPMNLPIQQPIPYHVATNYRNPRPNNPLTKPIRFVISNNTNLTHTNATSTVFSGENNAYPPAVKDYIERSYAAIEEPEDRIKVENYLRQRVEPLLQSGAVYAVNWNNEPLPHEVDFVVRAQWTPSNTLKGNKKKNQQQSSSSPSKSSTSLASSHHYEGVSFTNNNNNNYEEESSGAHSISSGGRRPKKKSRFNSSSSSSTTTTDSDGGNSSQKNFEYSHGETTTSTSWNTTTAAAATRKDQRKYRRSRSPLSNKKNDQKSFLNQPKLSKKQKKMMLANKKVAAAKGANWAMVEANVDKKQSRARRFATNPSNMPPSNTQKSQMGFLNRQRARVQKNDYFLGAYYVDSAGPPDIIGTCLDVYKPFFRLTAAPDPSQIRPLRVLIDSLGMVKQKYKANSDYRYACDQLKSIRQDLMIQNIRNEFTVLVYESNARIALENKDREEFNQCQNQLKLLYLDVTDCPNRWEFTAYRLLYYIYMQSTLDVSSLLDELIPDALQDQCMNFSLSIWDAWSMSNYIRFFRLYKNAPKMTGYVMDMFVERERKLFTTSILKSYRPDIPIETIAKWLGMSSEKELVEWFVEKGLKNVEVGGNLDCRQYANTQL